MNDSIENVANEAEGATRKLLDYYLSTGGEGFVCNEVISLEGGVDVDDSANDFQELGKYLCGMRILCTYNTGANGLVLYLARRWDCTFYALSQKVSTNCICTVLEHIRPDDSDYFLGDEEVQVVIERMKNYF